MKKLSKLLLAIIFIATTYTGISAVKYTTAHDDVVSINPFYLIWGQLNAQLEHRLSSDNSISFNAGFWYENEDWSSINIGASYKWYLDIFEEGKQSLNGFAIGPRIDLAYWMTSLPPTQQYSYDNWVKLSIGAEVSYKWVFGTGKWAVEPIIKYTIPIVRKNYNFSPIDYGIGVNLGYCF